MRRARARTALLFCTVSGAACNATGVAPLPTRAPTATPAPAATAGAVVNVPAALRGTWTADVQGTTASSGLWTLTISDSNLALTNPVGGDPFTLDPTSITEDSLVLPAGADCPDQTTVTPGSYGLALEGDTLTITLVSDSCGDRSGVLASAPWTRKVE
jgi:hypothetical protein